jgi:hypothetical protein
MATTRIPINRRPATRITPRCVEIFERMIAIECTCKGDRREKCEGCREHTTLDSELGQILKLKPWQFPALVSPDYPEGAGEVWREDALKLYGELERAASISGQ